MDAVVSGRVKRPSAAASLMSSSFTIFSYPKSTSVLRGSQLFWSDVQFCHATSYS